MYCKIEGCDRVVENRDIGLCSSHSRQDRKGTPEKKNPKPIKHMSSKKIKEINEYSKLKKEFFKDPKNRICRVCGKSTAIEVHHSLRKIGYADDWARKNGITLLNDVRFWIPVCSSVFINQNLGTSCHGWIENNVNEAIKLGLTLKRNERI